MAVKEIKDMGASVLTRLKKQAKETGINYQTCLQLFAQEEFLRKLEMSGYAENLVLKGGMFLYTISIGAVFRNLGDPLCEDILCAVDRCFHVRNTFFL